MALTKLQVNRESGSEAPEPRRQIALRVAIRMGKRAAPSLKERSEHGSGGDLIMSGRTGEKAEHSHYGSVIFKKSTSGT